MRCTAYSYRRSKEAEPPQILFDGVDVLDVLSRRIRIVEPEIARTAELLRHAEIEADGFRVTDMEVPVRLGRKARGHTSAVLPGLDVLDDDGADEVERRGGVADRIRCLIVHDGQPLIIFRCPAACLRDFPLGFGARIGDAIMHRTFSPFRTLMFSPFRAFRPLFAVALGIVSALGGAAVGQAQAPAGGQTDVLAALLTEVRGLRAAMEQMAAAGPRVQLALGRLQLQEQRVNTVVRRLEAVRTNLSAAQREHDAAASRLRDVEKAREAVDPSERKEAEMVLPRLQRALAQAAGEVQRLLAEESALNVDISGEQARWSDINRRLEELERSLARQ
jgi:hypothetical protein